MTAMQGKFLYLILVENIISFHSCFEHKLKSVPGLLQNI